jgi:hypothetical protein
MIWSRGRGRSESGSVGVDVPGIASGGTVSGGASSGGAGSGGTGSGALLSSVLAGDHTFAKWHAWALSAARQQPVLSGGAAGGVAFYLSLQLGQRVLGYLQLFSAQRCAPLLGTGLLLGASHAAVSAGLATGGLPAPTSIEHVGYILSGFSAFHLLGGRRTSRLLASDLLHVGAFAGSYVPLSAPRISGSEAAAQQFKYACPATLKRIQELGKQHGCHSCGRRYWGGHGTFIADHQPANKLVVLDAEARRRSFWGRARALLGLEPRPMEQRFLPQCKPCAQLQSVAARVSSLAGGQKSAIRAHWVVRLYHLTGVLLGGLPCLFQLPYQHAAARP